MNILAISGSLRSGATNTVLLEAAALLAPRGIIIDLYHDVGQLPHFNPDLDALDGAGLPEVVGQLRTRVGRADGLLISCPEYAHGIPGSFKNVLDWLVGSTEFPGKPVALLSTSPASVHAPAQLVEVLNTMNARVVSDACLTLRLPRRQLDATAVVADDDLSAIVRNAVARFASAIGSARNPDFDRESS